MQKRLLTAALASTLSLAAPAYAAVVTFDNLAPSPFADTMPLLGHNQEFYQSGYWISPQSNSGQAQPGDLVGAIVDGTDVGNTCWSVSCPTNNATSFYTALDDGYLAVGAMGDEGFRVRGFDASFLAASGDVVPGIALILRIQGNKVGGGTAVGDFYLSGPSGGQYGFSSYAGTAARAPGGAAFPGFTNTYFSSIFMYGLACNAAGSCSAFSSNKGQFALDNLELRQATEIPEPGSIALLALGLAGMGAFLRRRKA